MNEARLRPIEAAAPLGADISLRLVICGPTVSGKSSLIDRLLDGLQTERVQDSSGETAYRAFSTTRRAFVAAEMPGLEQHARDVAAGSPCAELVVLLADASRGLLGETRRQLIVAGLLGVRHVVLAVSDVDQVGFDRAAFDRIATEFTGFAAPLGFKTIKAIPLSGGDDDNVITHSKRMAWYEGPTLLDYLETIEAEDDRAARPLRMSVQRVDPGGYDASGAIASGSVKLGDEVVALPSARVSTIKAITGASGTVEAARAGDVVTISLADALDIAPGGMLAAARARPQVADQFAAHLIWMTEDRLQPGRSYLMKINDNTLDATVTALKHRIDVDTSAKLAAKTLARNEVGVANLFVAEPIAFDPHAENQGTGAFVLIDRFSDETVAVGTIDFALRRASNIHHQHLAVSKAERVHLMPHRPAVLWFTGLPGAGKSTIANLVEAALHARGAHTITLDGDNVRHGLNKDLGFTETDRVENIRRIGEVAKLMTEAGLIVLCSFISPFKAERRMVRELLDGGQFIEVFIDTPLEECIARDPKGLYRRAIAGEIKNFTGIDQAYEVPEAPELHLMAGQGDPGVLAEKVVAELARREIL